MSARPDTRIDAETAAARHAELTEILDRANRLYHQEDAPELADAEYDALFRELVELEEAVPALQTPDSPTQRVGAGPIASTFDEVRHRRPMLSLSNALSHDELRAFDARVRKGLGLPAAPEPAPDLAYVAELKIDGLAISLHYEAGRFTQGATRGDARARGIREDAGDDLLGSRHKRGCIHLRRHDEEVSLQQPL